MRVTQESSADPLDDRRLLIALRAFRRGKMGVRLAADRPGSAGEIAQAFNDLIELHERMTREFERVGTAVGQEGRLGERASLPAAAGSWAACVHALNALVEGYAQPAAEVIRVIDAVAKGDLSQSMPLEIEGRPLKGVFLQKAAIVSTMVGQLRLLASEVTRVVREMGSEGKLGGQARVPEVAGIWLDLTTNVNQLAENLTTQVRAIADAAIAVTSGDLTRSIAIEAQGELGALKDSINEMIRNLRDATRRNAEQDWLKTNLAKLARTIQGQKDLAAVSRAILTELASVVNAQHGVVYINESTEGEPALELMASYGCKERKSLSTRFKAREGLVGECAFEKRRILLTDLPDDYIRISSGLGEAKPSNIVVLPVLFQGEVKAVIELASLNRFSELHLSFLDQLTESIGIVLNTIAATTRTEDLLRRSQALTGEHQSQQEELRSINERLELQAAELRQSQELLEHQQQELKRTNEELDEKARLLDEQKEEVERKKRDVDEVRWALEAKADQLALTSKYKSEFLANMSHELRTPLNSLLILSNLLRENAEGTLTPKQVEFAEIVHSSGMDLLNLINEILDLSKVESGKMAVEFGEVSFEEVQEYVERTFRQVARDKGLEFAITLDPNLPPSIHTDVTRLQQVLKNLLSNAFKFTEQGTVSLWAGAVEEGWSPDHEELTRADGVVAFAVSDTGIGVPADKQKVIFEAFQQADGTTSRKYGGTGLGLSISREIARLLGGELRVVSRPGEGSTFTLYLPREYTSLLEASSQANDRPARVPGKASGGASPRAATLPEPLAAGPDHRVSDLAQTEAARDDREAIQDRDRVLLIVEDDPEFAEFLLEMAREKGFKGLLAHRGESAIALARRYAPDAITLDIGLPDVDGWRVLDRLKHDAKTRHIPVHIISAHDQPWNGEERSALTHLQKPMTREALDDALASIEWSLENPVKELLVVEDDESQREFIVHLIGGDSVHATGAGSGEEGLAALKARRFDCLVLDLGLPDMTGLEFLYKVKNELQLHELPIIVCTGKELTEREETELRRLSESIIVKNAASPQRLLAETAVFLHRVESSLPEPKRGMLRQAHPVEPDLAGRKVLVVDDDLRNVFALTSLLEREGMRVVFAERGQEAIEILQSSPDIEMVLMDIMMPEMDGYQTVRRIREIPRLESLPIIAVTAQAMRADRERCIAAGASDYIPKPVNPEQLLSLVRVWLQR